MKYLVEQAEPGVERVMYTYMVAAPAGSDTCKGDGALMLAQKT